MLTTRRHVPSVPQLVLGLAMILSLLAGTTTGRSSADPGTGADPVTSVRTTDTGGRMQMPLCGGRRQVKVGRRVWKCSFDDEFRSSVLSARRWMAQTTARSGWTTSDTCYIDSPNTISVSGGVLHLVARRVDHSISCGGAYDTSHTGGAIMSRGRFSQTYGRFQIRARFPATGEAGFWGDLWLYPSKLTYGKWPRSGEVDIAEHFSGHGNEVLSALHYRGSNGSDAHVCAVGGASKFHTYTLVWTRKHMIFTRDGKRCFTRSWAWRTGSTHPFDKPFFVMLSEGYGDYSKSVSSSLPQRGPVDVDYVRVYR